MKKILLTFLIIGLSVAISCNRADTTKADLAYSQTVKQLLTDFTQSREIPAMAAAVVKADTILVSEAVGIRKLGDSTRVTADDKFYLASNTKSVTATGIAHYVQEGEITWQLTPIEAWPTQVGDIHPAYHDITLEQLLSNQAGILPFTSGSEWSNMPDLDSLASADIPQAFALYLLSKEPPVEPSSQFLYSNGGFAIASEMVEEVVGKTWAEYVDENIFKPLGLNAGFGHPGLHDSNQPWGHWETSEGHLVAYNPKGSYSPQAADAAAGAVHMSINDYALYLQEHLRGLNGLRTKILSPKLFKELHTPRISLADSAGAPKYAMGWAIAENDGYTMSVHSGSGGRFKARATIIPEKDIAVAVFANSGNDAADEAVIAVSDSLLKLFDE